MSKVRNVALADIISIKHGFAFKGDDITSDSQPYFLVTPGNFAVGGGFKLGKLKYFRGDVPQEYVLRKGDLVVTMTDLSKNMDTLGFAATIPSLPSGLTALHNQRVGLVKITSPDVDARWLEYRLRADDYRAEVVASSSGTTVHHTSPGRILAFRLDLPPLVSQRAIATTLSAIDDKIESNRRATSISEELARTTFTKLFDLTQLDNGVALSDLFSVNPRRALKAGTLATYVGMSSLPEFSAEIYDWEEKAAASGQRFMSGDVLMARITPCLENGKTAVVDMLQPNEVGWGSTEYVVLGPVDEFSTAWIYCLVRDERIREFAIQSMSGTSGRQRFQADRFSQYRIAQPSPEALSAFNSLAVPMFARMTELRDETRRLVSLRDALLPELLSGRLSAVQEFAA